MLNLPSRTNKPRKTGITSIHDIGTTIGELDFILTDYSNYLDIAKLGIGTAYVTPNLTKKVELYRSYDIAVYFGGTLFEKFYSQGLFEQYLDFLEESKVNWIEVSNGTIDISLNDRIKAIEIAKKRRFNVVSEVGCKDSETIMAPSKWLEEIDLLMQIGCEYVITEGRDSGSAGLFRGNGEIRTGLLDDILTNSNTSKLIFEAPTSSAQMYFINTIGANVNLGNISPYDLLVLEAQRQGLRSETFLNKDRA